MAHVDHGWGVQGYLTAGVLQTSMYYIGGMYVANDNNS